MSRIRHDYPELLSKVPEVNFARLAAFIDGEGTIYINLLLSVIKLKALAFMKLKKSRAETAKRLTEDEFLQRRGLKMEIQRLNKEGHLDSQLVQ